MIKSICFVLLTTCTLPLSAEVLTGGRGLGRGLEVQAGYGTVDSLKGGVQETINGSSFPTAINMNFQELGIQDDPEAYMLGLHWKGRWLSFLVDYRQAAMSGSGEAQQDYRFSISSLSFMGQQLDYLLLPKGSKYDLTTETTWVSGALRFTPFTLNGDGFISFTPWLHLGLQFVNFDYTIRGGGTAGVERDGVTQRLFAINGAAKNRESAAIPEYGIGAELRLNFNPGAQRSFQVVGELGFRLLDFQGAIDSLGLDGDDFEDIDFTYQSIDMQLYAQIPIGDSFDFTAGVFAQQVEVNYLLDRSDRRDGLRRQIDLEYTLYGVRVGLLF